MHVTRSQHRRQVHLYPGPHPLFKLAFFPSSGDQATIDLSPRQKLSSQRTHPLAQDQFCCCSSLLSFISVALSAVRQVFASTTHETPVTQSLRSFAVNLRAHGKFIALWKLQGRTRSEASIIVNSTESSDYDCKSGLEGQVWFGLRACPSSAF